MQAPVPTLRCYQRNSATSRSRRVSGLGELVGVGIGTLEVGDDLDVLPEEIRKESGFGRAPLTVQEAPAPFGRHT